VALALAVAGAPRTDLGLRGAEEVGECGLWPDWALATDDSTDDSTCIPAVPASSRAEGSAREGAAFEANEEAGKGGCRVGLLESVEPAVIALVAEDRERRGKDWTPGGAGVSRLLLLRESVMCLACRNQVQSCTISVSLVRLSSSLFPTAKYLDAGSTLDQARPGSNAATTEEVG
jgi:hypothetical protein